VIFSQTKKWGHWQVGGKDFISLGPADEHNLMAWGLLEMKANVLRFQTMPLPVLFLLNH